MRPADGPEPLARLMIPLGRRDPHKVVGSIGDEYKDSGALDFDVPFFGEVACIRRSQYCKILEMEGQ